jgi:hypothetical protein
MCNFILVYPVLQELDVVALKLQSFVLVLMLLFINCVYVCATVVK